MTSVLAVGNQKGGVGKTATALGLVDAARRRGDRVLVIDLDQQGNATSRLGVRPSDPNATLAALMTPDPESGDGSPIEGITVADGAVPAGEDWPGVDVVPGTLALSGREQDQGPAAITRLRTLLGGPGAPACDDYDLVVLDCPPHLGQLTLNAMMAADRMVIVTEPEGDSMSGAVRVIKALRTCREQLGAQITLAGIIVNAHLAHRADRAARLDELRAAYGSTLLDPFIPEREAVRRAISTGQPISALGRDAGDLPDRYATLLAAILPGQE